MAKMTDRAMSPAVPVLFLGLFWAAGLSPALGEDDSPSLPATLQPVAWEIGAELYNFKYEESVMDEEGVFYGFNLGCILRPWVPDSHTESMPDGGAMLGFEGRVAFGQVDYDGSLTDATPLTIDNIDDYTLETRAIFGADWLRTDTMHTAYAGIGYRYLNDDSSFHPSGYERESNYVYLPIGYQFDANLNSGWSWGARLEYDIFLWGEQRSHLSDVLTTPPLPDIENEQDTGFGYRASVRFQRKYSDGVLIIEPFFRMWDIDDSDISGGWFEPANETKEYGVHFIWMF